jgi:hypothetical protein
VKTVRTLSRNNFARPKSAPFRVANPGLPGVGYDNTDFLYDSFSVAQAAAFPPTTPMFQQSVSASKTRAQTNMRTPGMLVNGEVFKLRRIRVIVAHNTYPADAVNILQNCRVSLNLGGREFITGPVLAFPGGGGGLLTAAANNTAGLALNSVLTGFANGVPDIHNAFAFEDDVEIGNNEQIQVDLVAETAFNMTATAAGGLGTTIYVFLDGRRLRKVS